MVDADPASARSMAGVVTPTEGPATGREDVREGLATPTGPPHPSDGSPSRTTRTMPRISPRSAAENEERERQIRILRERAAALGVTIVTPYEGEQEEELLKAQKWLEATDRVGEESYRRRWDELRRSTNYDAGHRYHLAEGEEREFGAWVRAMEDSVRKSRPHVNSYGHQPVGRRPDEPVSERHGARDQWQETRYAPHINTRDTFGAPRLTYAQEYDTFLNTRGTNITQSQVFARKAGSQDLPSFNGAVEEWPSFIAAFERTTMACGYSDDENLTRLQKALGGKARETVGHLLAFPSGLHEAMATLKARFGRPDLIVEAIVRKVRGQPSPTVDRLDTLVEFGYSVRRIIASVDASELPNYLYDVALLRELERKLPPTVCIDWARYKRKLREVTLREFGRWCGDLADDLCGVVDVSVEEAPRAASQRNTPEPTHRGPVLFTPHPRPAPTTHNARLNVHTTGPVKCVMCDGDCYSLFDCRKFQEAPVIVRRAVVNHQQRCRMCLENHRQRCPSSTICGINGCEVRHHRLLHMEPQQSHPEPVRAMHMEEQQSHPEPVSATTETAYLFSHNDQQRDTLLKYIPITVHGPRGRVNTLAILDEGSTSSFMEQGLADELGLKGTPEPLCLQWTSHVTRNERESVRLQVQVSGRHPASPIYSLDIHTVRDLALPQQSLSIPGLAARYRYLRGLPIDSYAAAIPRMLIGIDHLALGHPLKSVEGEKDEPIASMTRLGWVVGGPHTQTTTTASHCPQQKMKKHAVLEGMANIITSGVMAVRRFVTKRGSPLKMLSDKGTNVVGASRELTEALEDVNQEAMMTEFTGPEMKRTFSPPGAPHFGGRWERLVRSVKKVLSQFQLPYRPTDEVRQKTLAEKEFVKSRPLMYVPIGDVTDPPLTPNRQLLGSADGTKPRARCTDDSAALKWSWKKWVKEYLPTLTRRTKWFQPQRPLAEGSHRQRQLTTITTDNICDASQRRASATSDRTYT